MLCAIQIDVLTFFNLDSVSMTAKERVIGSNTEQQCNLAKIIGPYIQKKKKQKNINRKRRHVFNFIVKKISTFL